MGDKFVAFIKEWTINILQVMAALFFIGFVATYIADREQAEELFINPVMSKLTNCDALYEEILADFRCNRSDDCTMTRDEFVDHNERQEKYQARCDDSPE